MATRPTRAHLESCIASIEAPDGEGSRSFTQLFLAEARDAADQLDQAQAQCRARGDLHGLVVSVKDLFDVCGSPTWAGSRTMRGAPKAVGDASSVAQLRKADAVIIGKTNMTEFAFSGLGINPHFGTPRAPFARSTGLIPGGSSSGAAVSVADGLADIALGTDTGGSLRIPAAYCGLCGFKPTQARVARDGAIPLSPTLDCVGPIARDVDTIALVDAVLSGDPRRLDRRPVEGLRIGIVDNYVWSAVDDVVADAFEQAITCIAQAGVRVERVEVPEFDELPRINAKGGFAAIEAFAWHRERLETHAADYDPQVLARIMRGADAGPDDLLKLRNARQELKATADVRMARFDALVLPTVPIAAPSIAELETDTDCYHAANLLLLRNPSIANFFDWCSLNLPLPLRAGGSVGLMLFGRSFGDRALLAVGRELEAVLACPAQD